MDSAIVPCKVPPKVRYILIPCICSVGLIFFITVIATFDMALAAGPSEIIYVYAQHNIIRLVETYYFALAGNDQQAPIDPFDGTHAYFTGFFSIAAYTVLKERYTSAISFETFKSHSLPAAQLIIGSEHASRCDLLRMNALNQCKSSFIRSYCLFTWHPHF